METWEIKIIPTLDALFLAKLLLQRCSFTGNGLMDDIVTLLSNYE